MANIPGTILAAMISPGDTTATFATHEDIYGKGGLMTYTYLSSLSTIPLDRQKVGTLVYIDQTQKYYKVITTSYPLTGYEEVNWESTYTLVRDNSANWDAAYSAAGADLLVRALTANWDSTYTTVQSNSANWETAYAYVSANSANLTATNIIVTNDLTVADTVSAKFYQGTLIDWMTLVRGYKTTPTLNVSLPAGDVYDYVFSTTGSDVTYYRYIANDGSEDSFYGSFSNPTLSNLIATKKIIL